MVLSYRIFAVLRIALIMLGLGCAATGAQAAPSPAFTVTGVKVDVTADSAAAAREQAFAQAQQQAFRELADRLLPENEAASFKIPDDATISTLINDFEITEERLSAVQYVGTYTFRFNEKAVQNFFGVSGVSYADVSSQPVLILPYYQWGSRTVLWGPENPWLAAWARAEERPGLLPVVVPIGDVQDVADMGDSNALTYDPASLARITDRYGASETLVLIATPAWGADQPETQVPAEMRLMLYRTANGTPEMVQDFTVASQPADQPEALFDRAVEESQKMLQQDWKNKTLISNNPDSTIRARVRFTSMREWVETQQKLRRISGITDIKLLSLKPDQADIELLYRGNEERLQLALQQHSITLARPSANFIYDGMPEVYDLYLNKDRPAQ